MYNSKQKMLVECSIGEIVDKLTILDIKCEKIKDYRLHDCIKEKEMLENALADHLNPVCQYYRQVLRWINLQIWEDQDVFRTLPDDSLQYGKLAKKIIDDNDARFRVKRMINNYCASALKEQKSYTEQTCVLMGFTQPELTRSQIAWIRYNSTIFDQIIIDCSADQHAKFSSYFQDTKTILIDCVDKALIANGAVKFFMYPETFDQNVYFFATENTG